ncbi:unnamed protein product [Oikopleura dioica]|nr:unnamed protein product [Oikopleura dioica]
MVETQSGISVKRASSFRIPMTIQRKRPKQATMQEYDSQTAMPLKSQGWRGSVEVISDVELTVSDTEMCSSSRSRRTKVVPKYISGFVYRSSPVSCDQQSWDSSSTKWRKYYAVTSGSVIAVSDPTSFMLQEKIKLNKALIKECRLRGRGVLFIQLQNEDTGFLLR